MATTTPKPDVRFIVDVRPSKYSDHGRLDAVAYPIVMEDGKIRNPSSYSPGSEYADLRVEGWVDRDSSSKDDFYYGYEPLEYREVFSLALPRAEVMVKTLRSLNKKVEALSNKFGRPTDFAGYLGYLAIAVGGDGKAMFARKTGGRGWTHDECEYRWLDVDGLRYYFQDELRKWRGDDSA